MIEADLPVYDALILKNIEPHHLLLNFSTSPSSIEIWRNGTKSPNAATVVLHHRDDQDVPVSITIQTKKACHDICVQKGESRSITVKDMMLIFNHQTTEKVQARLDIQLNMVQRKKIRL